jgi:hypothetical protein
MASSRGLVSGRRRAVPRSEATLSRHRGAEVAAVADDDSDADFLDALPLADLARALEDDPHIRRVASNALSVAGAAPLLQPPLLLRTTQLLLLLLLPLLLARRAQTSPVAIQGGVRRVFGARTSWSPWSGSPASSSLSECALLLGETMNYMVRVRVHLPSSTSTLPELPKPCRSLVLAAASAAAI